MKTLQQPLLILFFLLIPGGAAQNAFSQSKQPNYGIAQLPDSLKEGADAVLRYDANYFEIKDKGHAVFRTKYALTILKRSAEKYGEIALFYDSFRKIEEIKGTVYDQQGEVISRLKKGDIQDMSAINDFSIHEDSRKKVASLKHHALPYTVEFELEVSYEGLLAYRSWVPQYNRNIAVQESFFELTFPESLEVRVKEYHLTKPATKKTVDGQNIHRWETSHLTTWESEPYAKDHPRPKVFLAPVAFEMEGYEGKMDTWENFGKWLSQLNEGRQELPEKTVTEINQLVKGEPTIEAKTAKLYAYLQNKTRYVSIQLGIGGLQPFPATEVDSKGYGDCKALSNYMHALLKSVGIPSHYALIQAGDSFSKLSEDFPFDPFNHVILCVPNGADTIWLECTSQSQAFGAMGSFTDSRKALLVTPYGGKLANTPGYTKEQNLQLRRGRIEVGKEGDATAEITSQYHGLQEGNRAFWVDMPQDELKKVLYSNISISNFEIADFEVKRHKKRVPFVEEHLTLSIRKCASVSGKRMFLQPNLMSVWESIPREVENRQSDVLLSRFSDFVDIDTMEYQIPVNFHVEYMPEPVEVTSPFGRFQSSAVLEGNTIIYIRRMEMNKGTYPKESYKELIDFFKAINKADKAKIVLIDKT